MKLVRSRGLVKVSRTKLLLLVIVRAKLNNSTAAFSQNILKAVIILIKSCERRLILPLTNGQCLLVFLFCFFFLQSKGHHFVSTHYTSMTFCNHCSGLLWGIGDQGYQCSSTSTKPFLMFKHA